MARNPCSLVEEHFQTEVPDLLWHYTDEEALRGIVTTKAMWATDIRHLNDPGEFFHIGSFLPEQLDERIKKFDVEIQEQLRSWTDESYCSDLVRNGTVEVFVVSFSAACDDLGQWRAYGKNGRGLSFAFALKHLRPPKDSDLAMRFAPCIYSDIKKKRLLSLAVDHLFESIATLQRNARNPFWVAQRLRIERIHGLEHSAFSRYVSDSQLIRQAVTKDIRSCLRTLLLNMVSLATHCKHKAYEHEQERRLSFISGDANPAFAGKRRHRIVGGKSIPFIELPFAFAEDLLPLQSIQLGPCFDHVDGLSDFLAQMNYKVPLDSSKVPMRC